MSYEKSEWWSFFCMQRSMKVSYKSILWVWFRWSSLPKVPKIASLQSLSFISNKKSKMKLVICMLISIKDGCSSLGINMSCKVIQSVLMGMIKHCQSTQCKSFAIFLQYLKIYLKKVSTSWHYRFWWKWPDILKVPQNRKLITFLQCLKKKCHNCYCALLWCKVFRYFTGSSHIFVIS